MAPNWKAIARRIDLFDSDYDDEILAAVNALKRCLKAENITLAALASRIAEPQHNIKQQPHSTISEMAQQMLREGNLSDKESHFVFEMMALAEAGRQMSPRQSDWFNALLRRHGDLT